MDRPVTTPSEAGKKKYPPDGRYDDIPCTCRDDCPDACKGVCGCDACSSAYGDAMEWDE